MRDDDRQSISYQINVSVVKSARCDGYASIVTVVELPHMSEVTLHPTALRGRFFREPAEALAAAVSEGQRAVCDAQRARLLGRGASFHEKEKVLLIDH